MIFIVILILLLNITHNTDGYTVHLPLDSCEDIANPKSLSFYDYDLAFVKFTLSSSSSLNISLYGINDNCYECLPTFLASNNSCFGIWTVHQWTLLLIDDDDQNGKRLATISTSFKEFGGYNIQGTFGDDSDSLIVTETVKGVSGLTPLYITIMFIILVVLLSYVSPYIISAIDKKKRMKDNKKSSNPMVDVGINYDALLQSENEPEIRFNEEPTASQSKKKSERLSSLDTYRGLSLTLMIFVNYGGGGFWFFEHSPWNGLTFADLLFPSFMFISGVSLALSMKGLVLNEDEDVKFDAYWKAIKRALILFGINMFLANGYDYTTWRIPGVLFYFAVSGLVTSLTALCMMKRTRSRIAWITEGERRDVEIFQNWKTHPSDKLCKLPSKILLAYAYEWTIQACILLIYLSIALGAKIEGCPRGYNGPGGISEEGKYFDCTGGIHRWIDIRVFGYNQIYHHPTCVELYDCIAYDPEGLLGSLSACLLCYLGLMAGRVLIHFKTHKERLVRWFTWAIVFLLLAGILCGFSQNDGVIPINKNLWSTSFVLVNAGIALINICICYTLIDIYNIWSGAPFIYLGMNSILIYFCHDIFMPYFPFSYMLPNYSHSTVLLSNMISVISWMTVAFFCYRNKFFVKI